MIFLGDLACPPQRVADFNASVEKLDVLSGRTVVLNFEAVIPLGLEIKPETLYNHPATLDSLQQKARKVIVSLANNHMYDYPEAILPTKEFLESKGIGVFGLAGPNGEPVPYEFEDEDGPCALFGHCWSLYSATNPNRENAVRIVDCDYLDLLHTVKAYIGSNPQRRVYCMMHWNYDLERLPFPMHIRLAHDLIDEGVQGVIGSHSHFAQDVELYKGKPVAYCLGNFYLPSGIYFDGRLNYPEDSKTTVGIKTDGDTTHTLYFDTDRIEPVRFAYSALITASGLQVSDIQEYTTFFKKRRTKKLLVPVFISYSGRGYERKMQWAVLRVKLIKLLIKLFHK